MKQLFNKINGNLKAKVVIFIAGIMLLFLTGSIIYNIRVNQEFYMNSTKNQVNHLAGTIERSLVDAMARDRRDEVQRIMEQIGTSEDITDLRIFSSNNVVLRSSDPAEIGIPMKQDFFGEGLSAQEKSISINKAESKLTLIKPIFNQPMCHGCHDASRRVNGVLQVGISTASADTAIRSHLTRMIASAGVISILMALSVIIVLEILLNRPIQQLRDAMGSAERGEKVEAGTNTPDEIGQLHGKFAQMLGRINELHQENIQKEVALSKSAEVSNSHARLKSIIEAMPEGVSIMTPDMVIQEMNPRNMELFPGVQIGEFCYRSIHGRSQPCPHCGVVKVFEDGNVHEHQSTFYLPDGTERIVHSTSAPVRDKDGNITHAIEVVRDITTMVKADKLKMDAEIKHKRELEAVNQQLTKRVQEVEDANQQIATLIKDLAHKNTDLEKVVERLTTVNQIGSILNSLVDSDNVLEVIVKTLSKTINAEICSLMLMQEGGRELEVACSVGLEGMKLGRVTVGEGISGYVAKEGKPLLVVDIESDPRFSKANQPQYTTTSLIASPMFSKGKVIGVINVNNKVTGEPFNQDDLDLLTTVAGQASIAVENSNLYNDIRSSYFDTVRALVNALEAKDKYSKGHSERVTLLAMMMAEEMGLSEERRQALQHAGVLHDIGKIGISLNILNKNGKLTGEEFDVIKDHPLIGEKILDPIAFLKSSKTIVADHHERFDGKGYPHQKKGSEICLEAKILAVADTFDALTSDRPYRKALPFDEAVAEVKRCSATQFDPEVVDVFMRAIGGNGSGASVVH